MSQTEKSPDPALWQRSRMTDAPADEIARFLDLAGFADGLLDPDERERIADLVAGDPAAAGDVAAAQALARRVVESPVGFERIVVRACALVPDPQFSPAHIIAFAPRRRRVLHGLAQWGSLAAAILVASWLGFSMGSDTSMALSHPGLSSDNSLMPELFDPGTGFLRDFGENLRS